MIPIRMFGALSIVCATAAAVPRVLVLSGGGGPHGNHYSQYLQTKLLADELRGALGDDLVTVRFGAGNDLKRPVTVHDVHRRIRGNDGLEYSATLPGRISGNAAATKEAVIEYFQKDAEAIGKDDTFFLFVTGHGEPNEGDATFANNCIGLWGFDANHLTMRPFSEACLSVSELGRLLNRNVRAKKSVFAMTQCFSGGFHQMSVRSIQGYPTADVDVCGFTAVTPDTVASGCTADVDGPRYKGYERYLAQQLTGIDVVTGKPMPYPRKATLREAHVAAALEDTAKDIPFSTSDYYLTSWADALEANGFQLRTGTITKEAVEKLYRRALDASDSTWPPFQRAGELKSAIDDRLAYLKGTMALIGRYDPETAFYLQLPFAAFKARLDAVLARQNRLEAEAALLDKSAAMTWKRYGFEPWKAALAEGKVDNLTDEERDNFERGFLTELEAKGGGMQRASLFRMAVWSPTNGRRAESLGRYLARREGLRDAWLRANSSSDAQVQLDRSQKFRDERDRRLMQAAKAQERYDQLRRLYFTRRQIAAATVLAAANDKKAIAEVTGLEECERTAF